MRATIEVLRYTTFRQNHIYTLSDVGSLTRNRGNVGIVLQHDFLFFESSHGRGCTFWGKKSLGD